ncbi:isocitrate lyase [Chryseobacterium sp. SORGH_AS1175]|nr:isocitrate lyase [Chryseobacterium sp. SORGH_AS_1175]
MKTRQDQILEIEKDWLENPRWSGIKRPYTAEDVLKLRGSYKLDYTIATEMAGKFWNQLNQQEYVAGLGALTGNQAVQEVDAGLEAIYLSGWQVAADANLSGEMYPDQSLYPANSVPSVVKKINNALLRADQIQSVNGGGEKEYLVPIVADAEAGFGGNLNAYELMKQMIEAGAAAVHFEDQLSSAKKCGHLGGKVLVPTQEAVNKLISARLAADVLGVPTLIYRTNGCGCRRFVNV